MSAEARHGALVATARQLLADGGTLQSLNGDEQLERSELQPALVKHLGKMHPSEPAVLEAVASRMLDRLDLTLAKASAADTAPLTADEFDNLEVIVQVLGRPALRLIAGLGIEPFTDTGANEHWAVAFNTVRNRIRVRDGILASARSVARILLRQNSGRDVALGSGWRLGDELLVTNRHVVCELVADRSLPPSKWTLDPGRCCMADFNDAGGIASPGAIFAIVGLAYCAPEENMDVAVLRLRLGQVALPPPLTVSSDAGRLSCSTGASFSGREVYVVGHPLMRLPTPETAAVFVDADGSKRCAPGYVTGLRSDAPWFVHDCSTLRGNSGSAVLSLDHHEVVGIHFGGKATDGLETVGPFNAAVALALLPEHPLRGILFSGNGANA